MKALYSSSALVCNFFHYWRFRDLDLILKVLEIESGYTVIEFEKKHTKPSEIEGIPPHLDVEITGNNTKPFAIESKFTEPYMKKRKTMKPIYGEKSYLWDPLSSSRRLVDNIISGKEIFDYLDTPQLLKHILGLKTDYGPDGFKLLYLWYKVNSSEAIKHEDEIRRFIRYVSSEVVFYCFTYQELFAKVLKNAGNRDKNYISYMKSRYF